MEDKPMLIKALFLDVYGTILCEDDPENAMPIRLGFVPLLRFCQSKKVMIYTASDADLVLLKLDLEKTLSHTKLDCSVFDGFFKFIPGKKKDFSNPCKTLGLLPCQTFVIGNNQEIDLDLAESISCGTCLVPTYSSSPPDNYNLVEIISCL